MEDEQARRALAPVATPRREGSAAAGYGAADREPPEDADHGGTRSGPA